MVLDRAWYFVRTWQELQDVHLPDLVARGVGQRRAHRNLGVAVVVAVTDQGDGGAEAVARPIKVERWWLTEISYICHLRMADVLRNTYWGPMIRLPLRALILRWYLTVPSVFIKRMKTAPAAKQFLPSCVPFCI